MGHEPSRYTATLAAHPECHLVDLAHVPAWIRTGRLAVKGNKHLGGEAMNVFRV